MNQTIVRSVMVVVCLGALITPAYAQGGGASSLTGVVVDTTGALIPGADVNVKNAATGATFTAVTSEQGMFTIPAIPVGTYTVTVSLTGFKTVVLNTIEVNAGVASSVRAVLEIGGLEETVTVESSGTLIQAAAPAVSTTLTSNQIQKLPLTSRNALDFVTFLPGVSTPAGNRDSTVNGLPQSAINITLDGISIQDNYLKSTDGFFARLQPRLDAIEEVTVTTAAQGAESAGHGAVQIRFTTRSGTNRYRGSAYHYYRNDALNANTWFNNRDLSPPGGGKAPKPDLVQHQPGIRFGGPIVIPRVWDGHDKAFFFVNYEELRQPSSPTRNRRFLHPNAMQGIFRYSTSAGVREINLFDVASRTGNTSTPDPTVAKLMSDILSATRSSGQVVDLTDPLFQQLSYQFAAQPLQRYPTTRVDFNLGPKHRLTGSMNYQTVLGRPDTTNNREPVFPGFPHTGIQDSKRYTTSNGLRSTLGTNLVNELLVGASGGATLFSPNMTPDMWRGSVANQGGFQLNINGGTGGLGIANVASTTAQSSREASTKVIEDTLTWVRSAHNFSFGASWTQVDLWLKNQTLVPTINFGIVTGDSADAMFNQTNFPGASTANLTAARNLYAILTGRVSSITANARLDEATGEYGFLGLGVQRGRMREVGLFAQDQWRIRPDLTVNFGLRYELQLPFYPRNNSYSTATVEDVWGVSGVGNLFSAGTLTGRRPQFINFGKGQRAFNIDWNNFAPNLGLAWTPHVQSGFLRPILGSEGDTVLRAGYTIAYNRHGMSDFSDVFGANPGVTINADRSLSLGNLGAVPLLMRDASRLGAPAFPLTPVYPMTEVVTEDVNIFDPNLQVPYAQTWTAGWQRAVSRNMAVEVRYVGTRHLQGWTEYDYNEIDIVQNKFLDEFLVAQRNLQANIAAGRGNTFAFTGAPGTAPLPIFLAYFQGLPAVQATDPSAYTSTLFTNSTFVNPLAARNPQPYVAANALDADATRRRNALNAGLAANFLVANPDLLGGANITGNGGYTRYDGLQLELRRRLANGLQFGANYAFGNQYISNRYSFRRPRVKNTDAGTIGSVTHAFKANWTWEVPIGQGRRFASNAGGFLDRLIGGWSIDGTARLQSGRLVDFGNVRLVGMTKDDFEKAFQLRFDAANRVVYMLPQEIIDNTVKAFSVSATSSTGYGALGPPTGRYLAPANGPDCIELAAGDITTVNDGIGDCGVRQLVVHGPQQVRVDLAAEKRVPIVGRVNVLFRAELLNAFNRPWFTPVTWNDSNGDAAPTVPDNYRVTGLSGTETSRIIQLVSRISW